MSLEEAYRIQEPEDWEECCVMPPIDMTWVLRGQTHREFGSTCTKPSQDQVSFCSTVSVLFLHSLHFSCYIISLSI